MKKILMIMLMGFSINSYADKDRGGGGGFLYPDGRVELLDLVEARVPKNEGGISEEGLEIPESNASIADQLERAIKRYRRYISQFPSYTRNVATYIAVLEKVKEAMSIMKNVGDDAELLFPEDANLKFKPRNSKEVGIALWDTDFSGKEVLWVDNKYFQKMNDTNKAALLLHEAWYKVDRMNRGATDSKETRRYVGYLFSNKDEPKKNVDTSDDTITIKLEKLSGVQCEAVLSNYRETSEDKSIFKILISDSQPKAEVDVKNSELTQNGKGFLYIKYTRYLFPQNETASKDELKQPCQAKYTLIHKSSGYTISSGEMELSPKTLTEDLSQLNSGASIYLTSSEWNSGMRYKFGVLTNKLRSVSTKSVYDSLPYKLYVPYQDFVDYPAEKMELPKY